MKTLEKILEGLGLKPGGLPGIVIPFALLTAAITPFRESLFGSFAIPDLPVDLSAALAAIAVMLNKVIADAVLDRLYDHFYGESFGKWESSTSSKWLFFPRGHDLQDVRGRVRRYFVEHSKEKNYGAKDDRGRFIETIYSDVMHGIEKTDPGIYRAVQAELSWSKTARNSILPLAAMGVSVLLTRGSMLLAVMAIGLSIALLVPCFSLRYMHQLSLYHRFSSRHPPITTLQPTAESDKPVSG